MKNVELDHEIKAKRKFRNARDWNNVDLDVGILWKIYSMPYWFTLTFLWNVKMKMFHKETFSRHMI